MKTRRTTARLLRKNIKAMDIIFATNNQHKLCEVREILGERFNVLSLADIGCHADIPETGSTLEENAMQKAIFVWERYHKSVFADDTGLEVEALGGEPGVRSARYADGKDHDSEANMRKLLKKMEGVADRRAQFRTVIAVLLTDESGAVVERKECVGVVKGQLLHVKSGTSGFGYDPIFVPEGYNESFAALGDDIKNTISHRARAVKKLAELLLK